MQSQLEERQMLTSTQTIDWSRAVEDNREWIGCLVIARTGGQDLVEDVIQELCLAVTRSKFRPMSPGEVAPWLCRIVIRQCAMIMRNQVRQRRKLEGFSRTKETEDAEEGDPIFWLLLQEKRDIVRQELGAVDPQARKLLMWKYINNMSYQEIASRLEVSRHVAEYRVIEARKELRRRLQARGIEGAESP